MTRRSCQTVPKKHKNLVVVSVPKALTIIDNRLTVSKIEKGEGPNKIKLYVSIPIYASVSALYLRVRRLIES